MTDSNDSIECSLSSITSTWLERAGNGDNDAWSRLETAYHGLVCWWCGKSGIPNQDIDDLAQEVFAGVAKSLAKFEHRTFRGFLWTITRNKIHDYWRNHARQPIAPGGSSIQEVLANVEAESSCKFGAVDTATKIVFDAIVKMVQGEFSQTQWEAFWQVTVEGASASEVADSLGITPNQVYLAKSRILRRIRTEFGDETNNPA